MRRALLLLACLVPAWSQRVALTFDDGPGLGPTPRLAAPQRNEALLKALREAKVQAVLFANGREGGDAPEGLEALRRWGQEGHLLGNHTWDHLNLERVSPDTFLADVARLDAVIKPLPGYRPWLRFPYLKEGSTAPVRNAVRQGLAARGYRGAPVTIASFDWLYDEHLRAGLKEQPNRNLGPLRTRYLEHLITQAEAAQALAKATLGRDVDHVLLLHHTLLNALFLPDVIRLFRDNGWTLIGPEQAYRDPAYAQEPKALSRGTSHLMELARDRGQAVPESLDQAFAEERERLKRIGW